MYYKMLIKILSILAKGGVNTFDDIAGFLGTNADFAEQMIPELFRRGYLKECPVSRHGSGCCKDCSGSKNCGSLSSNNRMWELTEKGKRVIQGKALSEG